MALLALLLASCAGEPQPGAAPDAGGPCPRGAPPIIRVSAARSEPARDDSLSLAQLSHLDEAAFGHVALGATESKFGISTLSTETTAPSLGAGFCAHLTRMDVTLRLSDRTIHVAREFYDEACVRDEVLAHELRHVRLDDRLLQEGIGRAEAELAAALNGGAAAWGATPHAAEEALKARLAAVTGTVSAQFTLRRRLAHAEEIDTPAESRRAQEICGGRVSRLLATAPQR